ncbi:MAG: family ATPase, partial [Alphaproteobacteria bacterium]|nr:family ATPase [Alphaproteobacteria bacterium]
MGEKLLAQRILMLLRETSGRGGRTAQVVLDWAAEKAGWLWPAIVFAAPGSDEPGDRLCWDSLAALVPAIETDDAEPELFRGLEAVSDLLDFDAFDRDLLRIGVGFTRLPRLASLRGRLPATGVDLLGLVGRLAGADPGAAVGRVRRSGPLSLGLLHFASDCGSGLDLELPWRFGRLLDGGLLDEDRILDGLAGLRQPAGLGAEDFAGQAEALDLLTRLLRGALDRKAAGINLLIYGPPGTGKTELARTLAASVGASLFAVGESDEEGDEPSRYERLHALKRAERLLARRGDSILLFDEMEDLFAEAQIAGGSGPRAGSKIFVNRLLEQNRVPTIWTSNSLDVDPAHLRRLTYILRMDYPGPRARARIVARVAADEGAGEAAFGLDPLVARESAAAAIARVTLRGAALAGGG